MQKNEENLIKELLSSYIDGQFKESNIIDCIIKEPKYKLYLQDIQHNKLKLNEVKKEENNIPEVNLNFIYKKQSYYRIILRYAFLFLIIPFIIFIILTVNKLTINDLQRKSNYIKKEKLNKRSIKSLGWNSESKYMQKETLINESTTSYLTTKPSYRKKGTKNYDFYLEDKFKKVNNKKKIHFKYKNLDINFIYKTYKDKKLIKEKIIPYIKKLY